MPPRWHVIGDPQAPYDRFLAVLGHAGLLDTNGAALRAEEGIVTIGDHFDFPGADPLCDAEQGEKILEWLVSEEPSRVVLLLGNHDTARVQEFASVCDSRVREARELARAALNDPQARAEYDRRFPELPMPLLLVRDYVTFRESQTTFVRQLLLDRRLRLAAVGTLANGVPVLLTHSGITLRDLRLLGLEDERDAYRIAAALNRFLDERVARVRSAWERGDPVALDLAPLRYPAESSEDAGGLLSMRPACPDRAARPDQDFAWEWNPDRPRRFAPGDLPWGLVQACGHVRHATSLKELAPYADAEAHTAQAGAIRTLLVTAQGARYAARLLEPPKEGACLYLLDGEMAKTPPEAYQLLALESVTVP